MLTYHTISLFHIIPSVIFDLLIPSLIEDVLRKIPEGVRYALNHNKVVSIKGFSFRIFLDVWTCAPADVWYQNPHAQKLSQLQEVVLASLQVSLQYHALDQETCPVVRLYEPPQSTDNQMCML